MTSVAMDVHSDWLPHVQNQIYIISFVVLLCKVPNQLITDHLQQSAAPILKPINPQLVNNFLAFYGRCIFINVFITASFVLILSQINPAQFLPLYFFMICFNIILQLLLSSQQPAIFSYPTKMLHTFLALSTRAKCLQINSKFRL